MIAGRFPLSEAPAAFGAAGASLKVLLDGPAAANEAVQG
jgi:hypothetical protein